MKKLLVLLLYSLTMNAFAQSNDTLKIRQAALDYVEGFYSSDTARIARAVHPDLAKRIIYKDSTGYMLRNMTAKGLIGAARHFNNSKCLNPGQPFKGEVIIYDIYKDIALAKIVTNKFQFIDYIQVGKFGDEWKIINVLWTFTKE